MFLTLNGSLNGKSCYGWRYLMMARALKKISLAKLGAAKCAAVVSLLFLAACAQTPTIVTHETSSSRETSIATPSNPVIKQAEPASGICPDKPKILRSTSKFIKLEHAMSQFEQTKQVAVSWCEQYNLSADFSTQKCDKCCESNFQCR